MFMNENIIKELIDKNKELEDAIKKQQATLNILKRVIIRISRENNMVKEDIKNLCETQQYNDETFDYIMDYIGGFFDR